jgi:predicted acylesterase/phospholipase RssA
MAKWIRLVLAVSVWLAAGTRPADARERPGGPPATGKGPDNVLQQLDRAPAPQAVPEPPAPRRPPSQVPSTPPGDGVPRPAEDALAASWKRWAPLFSPRLQGLRPTKGGKDMPTIQRARGEGRRLSAEQAALIEKLRSMLTPHKALVVSGGVSLGSYQAGFLYYTTLILRRFDDGLRANGWDGPDVGRFRVVTGASAGSINGFLSSLSGCRTLGNAPEDSPFFQTWIKVGLAELRKGGSKYNALFDADALKRPVDATLALLASAQGWTTRPCDGIFGITATRLEARHIDINDPDANNDGQAHAGVTLARQTEKFLLTFDVGDPLPTPRFSSYRLAWEGSSLLTASVYPTLGTRRAASPGDVAVDAADIARLLRASAAFPLAFEPVEVPLTVWEARDDKLVPHVQKPRFLDGGLLDNTPLRLAQKLLLSEGCSQKDGADIDPRGATILFSKSSTEAWRRPERLPETPRLTVTLDDTQPAAGGGGGSVIGELGSFVGQFINNATDMEALEALELMAADEAFDRPADDGAPPASAAPPAAAPEGAAPRRACRARRRIVSPEVPARGMPVAGQFLAHFGAFLEEDFRIFDFYQGVVDAQENAEKHLLLNPALAPVESPIFTCFRAYRTLTDASGPEADPPALPAACGEVSPNLKALLLASVRVRQSAWRTPAQDEFTVFLAALHGEGFRYKTLANDRPLDADGVQAALREALHDSLHELGRAQGGLLSPNVLAVSVGAKVGADIYRHRSPMFVGIGVSNGLELSAGLLGNWMRRDSGRLTLKLVPSLRWTNPDSFSPVDATSRLAPSSQLRTINLEGAAELRLEIDLRSWAPVQLELGAGYDLRYRSEAVALFLPTFDTVSWRHGPLASLSVILVQRLYVTLSVARWWQRACKVDDVNVGCPAVEPAYWGYEPIETNQWAFRLSGGWRALW